MELGTQKASERFIRLAPRQGKLKQKFSQLRLILFLKCVSVDMLNLVKVAWFWA